MKDVTVAHLLVGVNKGGRRALFEYFSPVTDSTSGQFESFLFFLLGGKYVAFLMDMGNVDRRRYPEFLQGMAFGMSFPGTQPRPRFSCSSELPKATHEVWMIISCLIAQAM